ncbi:MAG: hypothetical protein OEV91_11140, partial [Desulfobulbaceae bacterium]|nr:hypothetical protein [Desulfobulbaceae bacterium]
MEAAPIVSFRSRLGKITKQAPVVHRFLVSLYHVAILEIWPRLRRIAQLGRGKSSAPRELTSFLSLQATRVLHLALPTPAKNSDLIAALRQANIPFAEGGWTIYLPPSTKLAQKMPGLAKYPVGSGVKILRHLLPPGAASYTPNHLRPIPGAAHVRGRTPTPQELLRIAGKLAGDGIGPFVHDLVELIIGETRATAFIMEHVFSDSKISETEHAAFIAKLDAILAQGVIGIAHGDYRFSTDFRAPDCNGNLLKGRDGRTLYVDFQSFNYRDEKAAFLMWAQHQAPNVLFGPRRMGKNAEYLYQMVPGVGDAKRETMVRWELLDALLQK